MFVGVNCKQNCVNVQLVLNKIKTENEMSKYSINTENNWKLDTKNWQLKTKN